MSYRDQVPWLPFCERISWLKNCYSFYCLCNSLRNELLRYGAGIINRNTKESSELPRKLIRLHKLGRTAKGDISHGATIQRAKATNQPLSTSPTAWQCENLQLIKGNYFYQLLKVLRGGQMLHSKCPFKVAEALGIPRGMNVQSWHRPKLKRP